MLDPVTSDPVLLELPVLPLRDVVVFPHMVIPLFVGREKSVQALDQAILADKQILLVAQRAGVDENPAPDALYTIGTVASILQLLKLADGTVKVLVEGRQRVKVVSWTTEPYFKARAEILNEGQSGGIWQSSPTLADREFPIYKRSTLGAFEDYVKLNRRIPPEVVQSVGNIGEPGHLADAIMAHVSLTPAQKQQVLECLDFKERLEKVLELLQSEIEVLQIDRRIRGRVKQQMERGQREYYLNEQMKAIQRELGDLDEGGGDLDELGRRIEKAGLSKEARNKAEGELRKLRQMASMSAEATVVRNYIDTLLGLPWKKMSRVSRDIRAAERILEEDHYGLAKVKERILEYLAVQQRVSHGKLRGPIICLVGPPGVGKTSLGRSMARATGRRFVRMSLGGVRDEAEIRGHRRTYVGSMPGKIVQNLSKVGVRNPLFLLDEIDKMSMDFRGDPSSALLEVLDPEQNHTFSDHYLEVDFDLSHVLFVATANTLNVPPALLDRMEVIRISGYTEDEKLNIARRYLVPKALTHAGLAATDCEIQDSILVSMIRHYTQEAGVRNLEREISKVARKVAKRLQLEGAGVAPVIPTLDNLADYLGVPRFRYGRAESKDQIGQVTGLAWTEMGGDLLTVEAAIVPGRGKLIQTGHLGEVMQESIQAAVTVVRSRANRLGIDPGFYQQHDFHVHVPEGATPKDGPSAGVAMCTALVSALSRIPVRSNVAMTGEITLRGEVLPIGGLKEKLLAAHRGGITKVLIPKENVKDLAEIPDNIKAHLEIQPVNWIEEVLALALVELPNEKGGEVVEPSRSEPVAVADALPRPPAAIDPPRAH
ncbi:DNA-binding ATP-dependent protease La [mine drainage metagenome]|uniref:endopeptidase La n=2 Tax=mine drainage metagenome TaxID=410659 RepID=T1CT77_9ZZZZ